MIAGRRLSRGEGVHMPFVQVSVRQTEYTSKNELQIQNEATLSYNNRISIFPVPSDATQSVIVCVCVSMCPCFMQSKGYSV